MKSYLIDSDKGIDAIQKVDVNEASPAAGEVKIRMKAASLNYRDLIVAGGGYIRNDTRPVVPLSDGAGEVTEVGDGVTRWKVGDRVSPIFMRDWIDGAVDSDKLHTGLGGGVDGVLAESMIVREQSLVAIPDAMSFAEAAAVPCAGVTAWHALFESGNLQPGQTVLLLGTGGVSIFALQLAKSAGARVIITSSSDEKIEQATAMGADLSVNYSKHPDWHKQVRELTDGSGVDHVVEVGGPGTLARSIKSAGVGGYVHLIGVLDSPAAKVSPMLSVFNLLTIRGIYVGSRQMHQRMLAAMTVNNIAPVIDRTFSFDDAIEAYRYFASQKHVGKVVIEF
ncbi:alcohol dehydrogenase zinc-binding domain protein [Rhodopirellula maiorica SM1]|uniref:Alcohol dehydrogenase zinc-binding domain protein n=1 Tax=Rhodopirellula maiorica SM1 TaxID=1265738 RepID=M5RZJ3_9BACT|nr:NAD(P)-dependent alcohol dehydrogenase [Rhodopirellula maiorica]EMI20802.1 alcohol dehydrogenase zinc-binding domain protein [Rhodopirellula maiorica SM1]